MLTLAHVREADRQQELRRRWGLQEQSDARRLMLDPLCRDRRPRPFTADGIAALLCRLQARGVIRLPTFLPDVRDRLNP